MSRKNQIAEEREEVIGLYEDLGDAIEDEETEEARELLRELADKYAQIHGHEKGRISQARVTRESDNVTFEEQKQLSEFMNTAARTSARRAQLYLTGMGMIEYPDEVDEDFDEVIEQSIAAEQNLSDAEQSISGSVESARLPATIVIVESRGPPQDTELETNDTFEIEATIRNVGGQATEEIDVTVNSPDGLSFDDGDDSISSLPGGAEETIDFDGTVMGTGAFDVTVEATSESGGSDRETVPIIVPDVGIVTQVQESVPEWVMPVAGAGLVGSGIYAYLRNMNKENGGVEQTNEKQVSEEGQNGDE